MANLLSVSKRLDLGIHPARRGLRGAIAIALFSTLSLAAATTIYVLTELIPVIPKKPEPGYSVSGGVYKFENKALKCEVEYLNPEARGAYFKKKGYDDPLKGLASEEDHRPGDETAP